MKFTVLIPTHDNGPIIRAAVESVLAQTVSDWELFVVADGAPAETLALVEAYAARDARVRLFPHEKGERHGEAWRHAALGEAQGDAVCYLSDDDFWFPDHLEAMDALLQHADLAHTRHVEIMPDFTAEGLPERLDDPSMRLGMATSFHNIFGLTAAGHRLDAYRRLPVGWSPAPIGLQTDLHMWRKFIDCEGARFATSTRVTSVHFARVSRQGQNRAAAMGEVLYWSEAFRDPHLRRALRDLLPDTRTSIPLSAVAAHAVTMSEREAARMVEHLDDARASLAREAATRESETARVVEALDQTSARLASAEAELQRIQHTRTWRYSAGLRSVWGRIRSVMTPGA